MATHETRSVGGRVVLASNSVLLVAVGSGGGLDAFAAGLVAHGCTIHEQSPGRVALFRFETFVAPLLAAAQALVEREALAASATMAVRVRVAGRAAPSPKSVDIGSTLASEAGSGELLLSLQLASLLQATERECAGLLHTARVRMADGRERAVVRYGAATVSGPASRAGMGQVVGRLPGALEARLVERIAQRLQPIAPAIDPRAVRQALAAGDSAVTIAQALQRHVPREGHAALRLIVDDEVRWIRLRAGGGAG